MNIFLEMGLMLDYAVLGNPGSTVFQAGYNLDMNGILSHAALHQALSWSNGTNNII